MAIERPELRAEDLALLFEVAGWRRMIRDGEHGAACRLVAIGYIVLEIREGETWGEATPAGLELRAPTSRRRDMSRTMREFFPSGRAPSDD